MGGHVKIVDLPVIPVDPQTDYPIRICGRSFHQFEHIVVVERLVGRVFTGAVGPNRQIVQDRVPVLGGESGNIQIV